MKPSKRRTSPSIALPLSVLFSIFFSTEVPADTVTLRANVTVSGGKVERQINSKVVKVAPNQVAKIKHFYCFNTDDMEFMGESGVDNSIALYVVFDDLTAIYTHDALFGAFGMGSSSGCAISAMPEVVGPATLQLKLKLRPAIMQFTGGAICTVEVNGPIDIASEVAPNAVTATEDAIVIPENTGPVEIVLESSTNLQETWDTALPGIYGATDRKRFFRIKAVLK
ncbi:MAG: hypothetical protein AB9869_04700 [Verrucomicrobiia bacterium]